MIACKERVLSFYNSMCCNASDSYKVYSHQHQISEQNLNYLEIKCWLRIPWNTGKCSHGKEPHTHTQSWCLFFITVIPRYQGNIEKTGSFVFPALKTTVIKIHPNSGCTHGVFWPFWHCNHLMLAIIYYLIVYYSCTLIFSYVNRHNEDNSQRSTFQCLCVCTRANTHTSREKEREN